MAQGLYGWLFCRPGVTCTYWGLGGDLGEPVAFFTPAAVLESTHAQGGLASRGAKGSPSQAHQWWQNAALFFQNSLHADRE